MDKHNPTRVTAMVVATITVDADAVERQPTGAECTRLLGVGLVTHAFGRDGDLQFWVRARSATMMSSEAAVLDFVEDELQLQSVVTGYNLVTSILNLFDRADPDRHPTIRALMQVDWRCHQLSLNDSPVQKAPLSVMCEAAGIRVINDDVARDQRDWLTGQSARIKERLMLQAAGAWKLWATMATHRGGADPRLPAACDHLDAWLDAYLANQALPVFRI